MLKLTTSYVYLIHNNIVYYSCSNYGLTTEITKANFFTRESDAKARITNMKKNMDRGLWINKSHDRIYSDARVAYHTMTYMIAEPNVDFSA